MNDMTLRGKKVYIGLSGGVDSSIAAWLLRREGAQVIGIFIKGWYPPGLPCSWAQDRRDAMRVAAHMKLPFQTLDASTEYKRGVIDYLVREYREGRTPNPDVACNRDVKFGVFYRFAKRHGADFIATGHYARLVDKNLLRGVDTEKDQSYFLWAVPPETFLNVLFPIGSMHKMKVRALAYCVRLPTATKPDSQGICFLGDIPIESFLRAEFSFGSGPARDETGRFVGMHNGALAYTLGQRVGLTEATNPGPWFVQAKDIERNELMVGHTHVSVHVSTSTISFTDAIWHGASEEADEAQCRYHGPRILGHVENTCFIPRTPLSEVATPGQSIVFYHNDILIGGGIIR